jgi:hypothetical protein
MKSFELIERFQGVQGGGVLRSSITLIINPTGLAGNPHFLTPARVRWRLA